MNKKDALRIGAIVGIGAVAVTGITATVRSGGTESGSTLPPVSEPVEPSPEREVEDEVEVEPATPVPTEVGTWITEDQIEAARAAGAHVYVPRDGDGTALIVDPSRPLPDAVRQHVASIIAMPMENMDEFGAQSTAHLAQTLAMNEAGLQAVAIMRAPRVNQAGVITGHDWIASPLGHVDPDGPVIATASGSPEESLRLLKEQLPSFADAEIIR